ncbi:MAG: 50S ribosomal protein L1 [Nanoarchaeota archaeon]
MDQNDILKALEKLKAESKKRKFKQRIDFIINLKNLDLKKSENQVDFYLQLPHSVGRKKSICALVGPELAEEAKVCDEVVQMDDFQKFQQDKAGLKNLAERHDYFIAQANIMPKVAQVFGRVLGPRGKMPNPKAGCVVPPKANLSLLYERLQNTQRVAAKTQPLVQTAIGHEEMDDKDVAENALNIYDQLVHHLPLEKNNIRSVYIKMTMSGSQKLE